MLDELPTNKWGICHLNVSKEVSWSCLSQKLPKIKKDLNIGGRMKINGG
jgi:hypothetical protein